MHTLSVLCVIRRIKSRICHCTVSVLVVTFCLKDKSRKQLKRIPRGRCLRVHLVIDWSTTPCKLVDSFLQYSMLSCNRSTFSERLWCPVIGDPVTISISRLGIIIHSIWLYGMLYALISTLGTVPYVSNHRLNCTCTVVSLVLLL